MPQDVRLPFQVDPQILRLPLVLAGRETPDVRRRVESFYLSVSEIFELLGCSAGQPAHAAGLP